MLNFSLLILTNLSSSISWIVFCIRNSCSEYFIMINCLFGFDFFHFDYSSESFIMLFIVFCYSISSSPKYVNLPFICQKINNSLSLCIILVVFLLIGANCWWLISPCQILIIIIPTTFFFDWFSVVIVKSNWDMNSISVVQ